MGNFCDSLDFFRVLLHAFFAEDGTVQIDLGVFYLTFFDVEYDIIVVCYLH